MLCQILHCARRLKINDPGHWSTARFPNFHLNYQVCRPSWSSGINVIDTISVVTGAATEATLGALGLRRCAAFPVCRERRQDHCPPAAGETGRHHGRQPGQGHGCVRSNAVIDRAVPVAGKSLPSVSGLHGNVCTDELSIAVDSYSSPRTSRCCRQDCWTSSTRPSRSWPGVTRSKTWTSGQTCASTTLTTTASWLPRRRAV